MKKTFISAILSVILLIALLCLPVFSDGEANYAAVAPGGEIFSVDDVITVFGGDKNVSAKTEGSETRITFKKSIKLSAPVVIKNGTYRINGMDCSLFRGFENGSLILLDGSSGGAPKLIIEEKSMTDWETGKTAVFTFDGNSDEFSAAHGALLTLKGNAVIDFDGKVLFKNAVNSDFGGAIYAETVKTGDVTYSPSVTLSECKITGCKSLKGGGGIAFFGGKTDEGEANLTNVIIEKNEAINSLSDARGGGFYTNGGKIKISGESAVTDNKSNLGGGGYIGGFAELDGVRVSNNSATVSGGGLYCGIDTERGTNGSIAMNNAFLSYNSTDGSGGAIANEGTLLIGGSTYLTDCKANINGGGVYNLGSFGLTTGDIITNKAGVKGGAIYNGAEGILIVSGGRISSNEAKISGGIYSEGGFEFKGGSVGKNIGSVPQNLIYGVIKISGSATFTDTEVLGISVKNNETPTVITVEGKLLSRVKQTVGFFEEYTDENGVSHVKLVNKSGMQVFKGDAEGLESAANGFKVLGEGLKSFKIRSDGTLAFKMPLMPLWGWILSLIGVAGAAVGTVFLIKKIKKNKKGKGEDGEKTEPLYGNGKTTEEDNAFVDGEKVKTAEEENSSDNSENH